METILVAQLEYDKGRAVFEAAAGVSVRPAPEEELELAAAVRASRARAVIVGVAPYRGPLYAALAEVAAGRGALIARFGVGHDSVDKCQAAACGIVVTNTPGVLDQSVAEHAVWLMGGLARHVASAETNLRAGRFRGTAGIELGGKTLGVIGFGAIGRRVARIAHHGLGMRVSAADRRTTAELERELKRPMAEITAEFGLTEYIADCDCVFGTADVVTLHVPAMAETRHFVDRRRLELMQPTALLVNTARGMIVDENALYDALTAGSIAGAALDVYETEPYVPADPAKDLRTLTNTLLTPHIGSNTLEANRRMAESSLKSAQEFLAGRLDQLPRVG
jgi:lactate dehydrogenase-like 2-hydroxyacid dehydrogenase